MSKPKRRRTRQQQRRDARAAAAAPTRPAGHGPVLLAFFMSGGAGLMHQVVWSKLLVGLIGATAHAQAIVLAVFMGGLAIGSAWYGRRVDTRGRPVRTYVRLEVVIAVYCLLLPLLIMAVGKLYLAMAAQFFDVPALRLALRLTLAVVVVLFPAVLMGATLPVLARHLIGEPGETRRQVANLYGLNSLGAVIGAGVAGFVTLPAIGVLASLVLASLLNLAAAVVLLPLARGETDDADAVEASPGDDGETAAGPAYRADQYVVTLVALALSGFAAMGYEVLFVRVIALSSGLSSFSFTIMLMSFITGISLGSFIVGRLRITRPLWLLGVSQLAVVAALLVVTPVVSRMPYFVGLLRIACHEGSGGFELFQAGKAALFLAVLLVPTTCLGFMFPLVAHVQTRRSTRIGSHVGSTYAWNTVGNVLGAVLTSLVLLPWLGSKGSFHACFALNLVAGLALLAVAGEAGTWRRIAALGATAAVVAVYVAAGTGWLHPVTRASGHLRMNERPADATDAHPSSSFEAWKSVFILPEEGASHYHFAEDSHTTVLAHGDGRKLTLFVNGKPDASTGQDLPTQLFLAHMPLLLAPDAKDGLVIGYGSGMTAGAALRHPIESLDVVEISDGVLATHRVFSGFNHDALADERLRMYLEDGQSFLRATPRTYDVIISEPSNPWIAGIADLFTVEFFRIMRDRLNPGGLATIWFHEYEQSLESMQLVVRTVRSIFPHVEIFRSHNYMDLMVVAAAEPITPDFARMETRLDEPEVRNDLTRVGINTLAAVLMHHVASTDRVAAAIPTGDVNSIWHQQLEYAAPRALFADRTAKFVQSVDGFVLQRRPLDDQLLARYFAYRETIGEPVTREEMLETARAGEHLGGPSRALAGVLREIAETMPAATAPPTRPCRGAMPAAAATGLFEADYWDQRLTAEGRASAAGPFRRRIAELARDLPEDAP